MRVSPIVLHRLIQTITWQGTVYSFYRQGENEYGEKSKEPEKIADINGLYHNGAASHLTLNVSDAGYVLNKTSPYILMSWDNALKLKSMDIVTINAVTYKIEEGKNIGHLNIVGEVSLEEVS